MNFHNKSILRAVNTLFYNMAVSKDYFYNFKNGLVELIDHIHFDKTEEYNKTLIRDFITKTLYKDYFVNTSERIDLAIYFSKEPNSPVAIIFEIKSPSNKTEMVTPTNFYRKSFYELVLYYLREKITNNNHSVKSLVITNGIEWFIFDSRDFERIFARNTTLVNDYKNWYNGFLDTESTKHFYDNIAAPFVANSPETIDFVHFSLSEYISEKDKLFEDRKIPDDNFCFDIFKLLSPEHLMRVPFANDSNSLNKEFYNELLYILGLEEVNDGVTLIKRLPQNRRIPGSLIENTIDMLIKCDRLDKSNLSENELFEIALELVITWLNRILFLKLLESQLVAFNNYNQNYKFLKSERIHDFDELNELFFEVLAVPIEQRSQEIHKLYNHIPYLNSSLFEKIDYERQYITVNDLKDRYTIPLFQRSVLKLESNEPVPNSISTLNYLFKFLDAFDFGSVGKDKIREKTTSIINASVLGLIFEKINGYRDGAYFTPGQITMFMARQSIRMAIINIFREKYKWKINDFDDISNYIKMDLSKEKIKEYNAVFNTIKICDPAVGSGHFLVSCLNELIACKSELGILADKNGNRLAEIEAKVENDELVVIKSNGSLFTYNPNNKESSKIQQTLFHEKQTLIENCLFGVDINPKSVYITRLRLWIELLKNAYYQENGELQTLPNIDINIKIGDSLLSKFSLDKNGTKFLKEIDFIQKYKALVNEYKNVTDLSKKKKIRQDIENIKLILKNTIITQSDDYYKLERMKIEYSDKYIQMRVSFDQLTKAKVKEKENLERQIVELENKIKELQSNNKKHYIEWRYEFPEVLDDNGNFVGFDIVIGNPPYIQLQKAADTTNKYADFYKNQNYKTFERTGDIYCLFYEKGIDLLKSDGILAYITSNKWMRAGYGESLRKFFLEYNPMILIDLGPEVFENATVDTNILLIQKSKNQNKLKAVTIDEKKKDKIDFNQILKTQGVVLNKLGSDAWFIGSDAEQRLKEKIERIGKPLKDWDVKIYRGIVTGLNEAFIITTEKRNEILANCRDEDERKRTEAIIKPILRGRDIKRYYYEWAGLWVIFIPWHFPLHEDNTIQGASEKAEEEFRKQYPAVYYHLFLFKEDLLKRNKEETGIRYEWYALQRCAATYYPEFEKEKVVWNRITDKILFSYVDKGYYILDSTFMITGYKIKYLSGILNSNLIGWWVKLSAARLGEGSYGAKIYIDKTPLIHILSDNQPIVSQIEALVDKILAAKKQNKNADTSQWEREIDELVYKLYDLTEEEIKIIEGGK